MFGKRMETAQGEAKNENPTKESPAQKIEPVNEIQAKTETPAPNGPNDEFADWFETICKLTCIVRSLPRNVKRERAIFGELSKGGGVPAPARPAVEHWLLKAQWNGAKKTDGIELSDFYAGTQHDILVTPATFAKIELEIRKRLLTDYQVNLEKERQKLLKQYDRDEYIASLRQTIQKLTDDTLAAHLRNAEIIAENNRLLARIAKLTERTKFLEAELCQNS